MLMEVQYIMTLQMNNNTQSNYILLTTESNNIWTNNRCFTKFLHDNHNIDTYNSRKISMLF